MRIAIMLLPWLELFTLIKLGTQTSALTALAFVFATFVLGLGMVQRQGRGMLERLRTGPGGQMPGPELLVDDMALGFAGILLMIPGLITDFLALVVLIGPLRRRLLSLLAGSESIRSQGSSPTRPPETIEGTYQRLDD